MGKNSRRRRQRQQHSAATSSEQGNGTQDENGLSAETPSGPEAVHLLLDQAVRAAHSEDLDLFDDMVASMAALCDGAAGRTLITQGLRQEIDRLLTTAWTNGWQPADVHRLVARRSNRSAADMAVRVMHHQLLGYAPDTVHPSWRSQLSELMDGPAPSGDPITAGRKAGMGWLTVIDAAIRCLHVFRVLPPIEVIGPRPGEWVRPTDPTESEVDERVLTRVRMLLAKAESTPYEAEAETFTAGAASLIARHRISEATVAAAQQGRARDGASARRIGVDNPYEQPKVQLLDAIARASSCRTVWSRELGFATVVGFPSDLSGVELLYTSLLLQATSSMTAAGRRSVQGAHQRSRSFRASFLTSFALRIGERLQEASDAEERSASAELGASGGGSRLPALVEREQDVEEELSRLFPDVVPAWSRRSYDLHGWEHGRRAADQADMRARAELR